MLASSPKDHALKMEKWKQESYMYMYNYSSVYCNWTNMESNKRKSNDVHALL